MRRLFYSLVIISISTFLFEVFPYLVFGFRRSLPSPWNSWPDILDMMLWMPITVLIFFYIYESLIKTLDIKIRIIYLSGIILYVWGHGVHWAANSLDIPPCDTSSAYFLDEIFGHFILFLGFLIVLLSISFISPMIIEEVRGKYILSLSSAILFAFSTGAMALEGQVVGMFIVASLIILSYLTYLYTKYHMLISPSAIFFLLWSLSLLILLIIYYFVMGGFIQPSEWM